MKTTTIETSSYIIRPFKESDAALWQIWDIDPEVQAHMPEPMNDPRDIQEQLKYLQECEADENGLTGQSRQRMGLLSAP